MRNAHVRQKLEAFLSRLRDRRITVPDRALRFHAVSLELETQIQNGVSFWSSLWISDEEILRLDQRVARLAEIAERLADLIRKAESLSSDTGRVAEDARFEDAELTNWFHARCRDWSTVLARMGQNCERDSDLHRDEQLYADTEVQVRRHHEAALQWREAERVLALIRGNVRATPLASQLPQLRRRLYSEGPTPEWLDEIKSLIQPLMTVVNRIVDPPPDLADITDILTELRRWSEVLGGKSEAEIQKLRERQFKALDWDTSEVRDFGDEARALRTTLLEEATRTRTAELKKQSEELADLRQAYGDVPDLQIGFARLSGAILSHPHEFRDWQADLERFRNSFLAVAQSHMGELQAKLNGTIAQIREELDELAKRPLSAEVNQCVVLRRQEVERFSRVFEVEQILHQIRTVNVIAHDIQGLNRRADEELHEIERRQAELAARNERLQAEVRQLKSLKIAVPDVAAQIAALSQGTPEGSLEERRHEAGVLEMELAALECRFVEHCRQWLDAQFLDIQRAARILKRAGVERPEPDAPVIPAGAAPALAARAVLDARRVYQSSIKDARGVRNHLDIRREQVREEIARIRPEDLAPGDRQDAAQLLVELEDGSWSRIHKLLERIEHMTVLLEKCDLFVERLLQVERDARVRLAELHQSFRLFNEDQLTSYCHELANRVRALLFGVPAQPRQWSAIQHQLDVAATLFGRVGPHAKRRAAEELDRAADVLRRRVHGGLDPSGDLARLLVELEACGHEILPPVTLRLRVVNASQRRM